MHFCEHLNLKKTLLKLKSNIGLHTCLCIHAAAYYFCMVWFEIRFQIDLNLHSKFVWKLVSKIETDFSFPPLHLAHWPRCWPSSIASATAPLPLLRSLGLLSSPPRPSFAWSSSQQRVVPFPPSILLIAGITSFFLADELVPAISRLLLPRKRVRVGHCRCRESVPPTPLSLPCARSRFRL